ncbi:Outer membrane protein beta-barrel family protein [compost metagenome]
MILTLLGGLVCFFSFGQDQKITLKASRIPLTVLFKKIQAQCDYTFVYSDEVVSDTMMVSAEALRKPVSEVLKGVLPQKGLFYQLMSEHLIIIGSESRLKTETGKQLKTAITGEVWGVGRTTVPFATITLMEDSLQVNGVIANENGNFEFYHPLKAGAAYSLKLSSLGYESSSIGFSVTGMHTPVKAFGKIRLKQSLRLLKEVNVTGNQQLIEMEGGNLIFNVSRSTNTQGSNALELLGRAPGVMVSNDQHISLNGKAGAAILIDGKQTYLSGREIAELLKSMSASEIKSIEIISSPGPKYDASGTAGIINLKTQKSAIRGFSAGFTSGLSYGVYLRHNQDIALSYRKNRFTLYGNYNHFVGHYSYLYGADRIQEGRFYNSFTDDIDKRNKVGSRLGADFAINKNHTIGVLLNGNFILGGGITDTRTDIGTARTGDIEQTLSAINDYYYQQTERYNANLNYKYEDTLGRVFNFDMDYGDFTKDNGNLQSNRYVTAAHEVLSDRLYRSLNGIDMGLSAIKADYTVPLAKGKLETGIKYSQVSSDNDARFLEIKSDGEFVDPSRTNRFIYREGIRAAYVSYQRNVGKVQLQSGLRVEHTVADGRLDEPGNGAGNIKVIQRNYANWFPFFSATIKPSASHQFSFSYSRRIDRPAYQNLNPFIYLLDELSYWQGNPFLAPQLSHRLQLQYVRKSTTLLGLSYTYTDRFSVEVTDMVDQSRIVMIPRNLGTQQHLAFTFTQLFKPFSWWDVTLNGTFFGLYNRIDFGQNRKQNLKQGAGRIGFQQVFKLPYRINAEVTGFYNTKRLTGANKFSNATSQVDVGLQHNFKDNKTSLRLVFTDLYKGSRATSMQHMQGLSLQNFGYFETQQVKLNFSYRFASVNSKGPRSRSSALENENGRIK